MCVRVCVCVCVRACVRVWVFVYVFCFGTVVKRVKFFDIHQTRNNRNKQRTWFCHFWPPGGVVSVLLHFLHPDPHQRPAIPVNVGIRCVI